MRELIKNPRLSDRQVAKILRVSQPTVTRRRIQIEKDGLVEYTGIPDFGRMGFEIMAFTYGKWKFDKSSDTKMQAAKDFISKHPNIIFVSTGRSDFGDRVAISIHKNYSEYSKFTEDVRLEWAELIGDPKTFIISLKVDNILKRLTFKYLMDILGKEE
jgi:DNA-binding Lrp family transcriptional regulator